MPGCSNLKRDECLRAEEKCKWVPRRKPGCVVREIMTSAKTSGKFGQSGLPSSAQKKTNNKDHSLSAMPPNVIRLISDKVGNRKTLISFRATSKAISDVARDPGTMLHFLADVLDYHVARQPGGQKSHFSVHMLSDVISFSIGQDTQGFYLCASHGPHGTEKKLHAITLKTLMTTEYRRKWDSPLVVTYYPEQIIRLPYTDGSWSTEKTVQLWSFAEAIRFISPYTIVLGDDETFVERIQAQVRFGKQELYFEEAIPVEKMREFKQMFRYRWPYSIRDSYKTN